MTIEEMIQRKRELGYSYAQIAELSGIPLATVQKVFGGVTKSPRRETILALERALSTNFVKEPAAAYKIGKRPGEYTISDYVALPEEKRVELIDGVFYDMAAPSSIHQYLAGAIYAALLNHVSKSQGSCVPFIAPLDVQLDKDDKTMVQPDVMVVCGRDKISRRRIFGAPDFIVEILSPETRKKELTVKMQKYIEAGVREYWVIWPEEKTVAVYHLQGDLIPQLYTFNDPVPIGIWDNTCSVDFPAIYQQIQFLYESQV